VSITVACPDSKYGTLVSYVCRDTDIGRLLHQLVTGDRTNPVRLDLVLPHHTRDIGLKIVVAGMLHSEEETHPPVQIEKVRI
jgi:hypothetical protein